MLRQILVTPSRAARSGLRAAAERPFATSQFRAAPFLSSSSASASARLAQPSFSRWYSAETETTPQKESEQAKEGEAAPAAPAEAQEGGPVGDAAAALRKEIEEKTKEAIDWKDKYLRSVADFRNLQDRTKREMKSARDFAIQQFAKDLVDSVDNLDRALAQVPEEKLNAQEKSEHLQDLANLYEGLKMTETILMQTLKKHGLERFDPQGERFNPNEHEATFMTPMQDKEHNTVFHTQQKGFRLNGRVLRAAKVGVVKNK